MAKNKTEIVEGEVVDDGLSLSGGLVPVREGTAVAVPGLTNEEPDEDLGPPWIKIDQNTGEFDVSGEKLKELYAVLLVKKNGRTRFKKDEKGDPVLSAPICKSRDFKHGVGDPGGECAKCKLKDWPEAGGKPDCQQTYELLLAVDLGGKPLAAFLSLKGSAIKPTRRYLRNLGMKYANNPWRALTKITTVAEKYQGAKNYYVPQFEQVQGVDFFEKQEIIPVLTQLKAQLEEAFVRSLAEGNGAEEPGAAEY